MTILKKLKYKILAGFMAAGMVFGTGALTAFAAVADTDRSTASIEFEEGVLELLEITEAIEFAPGIVSSETKSYASTTGAVIQVSDNRGSATGWTLNANLGTFTIDGTAALNGAILKVNNAGIDKMYAANTSPTAVANTSVNLVAGSASDRIAYAVDGAGAGGWEIDWSLAGTTLTVLGDTARIGEATATINWSLEDVPGTPA